jgi:hypothetical protein
MLVLIARALHGRYKLLSRKRQSITVQARSIKTTARATVTPEGKKRDRQSIESTP